VTHEHAIPVALLADGTLFAGYRIEGLAGQGGMAVVYRATELALGRPVALKVMSDLWAFEPELRARFEREARVAAAVDHPNVVPIYHAGDVDGRLFIAMRYVDGLDLGATVARDGALPVERALQLVGQVAAALEALHQRGFVHRDVKPANLLLDDDDHVYLSDFGVTGQIGSDSGLTQVNDVIGTAAFVAPEQILGEPLDARADVYALGCVLVHILTGRPPFHHDTVAATMYAHVEQVPPAVSGAVADAPAGLDELVAKAMAKDPDDRFQSAAEFARAAAELMPHALALSAA
jgi:serine/threonine-protein kinase